MALKDNYVLDSDDVMMLGQLLKFMLEKEVDKAAGLLMSLKDDTGSLSIMAIQNASYKLSSLCDAVCKLSNLCDVVED